VRVYSELGKGTTVCLYFPRYNGAVTEEEDKPGEAIEHGFGETILVVDDNEAERYYVSRVLSRAGFAVREAATGLEALTLAKSDNPSLITLDVRLPDLNGFEVCRRLRADPQTANVPVLIISALDDQDSRNRATEAGATSYYTKPFSPIALLKEIERLKNLTGAS